MEKKSQRDPHLLFFLKRVGCYPSCSNLLEDFHESQLAFPQCTFQKKLHWDVHQPLRTFYLQMLAKWGNMNCIENTVHSINILPEKSVFKKSLGKVQCLRIGVGIETSLVSDQAFRLYYLCIDLHQQPQQKVKCLFCQLPDSENIWLCHIVKKKDKGLTY